MVNAVPVGDDADDPAALEASDEHPFHATVS